MISKQEFDQAYNKFPPSSWIRFAFRYFSRSTVRRDAKVSSMVTWILGSIFAIGFIATIAKASRGLRGIITALYCVILFPLVLFLLAAGLANNRRIKKICRELGVDLWEYEVLVDKYYPYPWET